MFRYISVGEVYLVRERTAYTAIKGVSVTGGQFSLDLTSPLYQHNMNKIIIIGLVLAIFAAFIVSDVGGFPLDKKASFLNIRMLMM